MLQTAGLLAMVTVPVAAQPAASDNKAGLRDVFARMDTAGDALYRACPADVHRKSAGPTAAIFASQSFCTANPAACYEACIQLNSHEHCFNLARVIQDADDAPQRYAQMLFTAACAAGKGSGCTNRAAGMRNGRYEDDPFNADATKAVCMRRSFTIACAAPDAWGCAMLGQAWQNGEGGPKSRAKARVAYSKACAIDPNFAACDFARGKRRALQR
ncbi:MAG: tetratricopeptide repeat protein [Beijerinckiaceae bacterium]